MESRWYVPKGKSLENTRIEERDHALHLTQKSWNNICTHLERNRLLKESLEREEEHRKAMKASSMAMTKNWNNSVENIRKRQEEERKKNLNQKEDKNQSKFLELKKEQEGERRIYVAETRKKMARKKDYPKALDTALILGKVIYEREKQVEFKKKIKEHERETEDNFADAVRRDVLDEIKDQTEKYQKHLDKQKSYSDELKEQISKNNLFVEKQRSEKIANELKELELSMKEIETITRCKQEADMDKKNRFKNELDKNMEYVRKQQERIKQEELEYNDVLQVINKCKEKIECLKKEKAAEIVKRRLRTAEEATKLLEAKEKEKEIKEEEIYKKAIAEKILMDENKKLIEIEKKMKFKEEKVKDYLEFQEKEKARVLKEKEISKWHLLNRLKQTEENVRYENLLKIKKRKQCLQLKEKLDKQMVKNEMIKGEEEEDNTRELEKIILANKEEDGEFLTYAKEVLEFAQKRGWQVFAIQKIIQDYKKDVLKENDFNMKCEQ